MENVVGRSVYIHVCEDYVCGSVCHAYLDAFVLVIYTQTDNTHRVRGQVFELQQGRSKVITRRRSGARLSLIRSI